MYTVGVRDHIMIAHSLSGETFGPAQQLHGATYVVDVELKRTKLDADSIVVDIGKLHDELKVILALYNYQNLDSVEDFKQTNTTTEFLAHDIFQRLATRIRDGALGEQAQGIETAKVTLGESHIAWACYEGPINP